MRYSLFCDVSRRRVLASNRRFDTTLKGSSVQRDTLSSYTYPRREFGVFYRQVRNCLFAHRMNEAATNSTKQCTFYQIRSLSCSQVTESRSTYKAINSHHSITYYLFTQLLTHLNLDLCLPHDFVSSCIHPSLRTGFSPIPSN